MFPEFEGLFKNVRQNRRFHVVEGYVAPCHHYLGCGEGVFERVLLVARIRTAPRERRHKVSREASAEDVAADAGIGWFGKNDVIITKKYGPRVR